MNWVRRALSKSISELVSCYTVSQSVCDNLPAGVWLGAMPLSAVWWWSEAEEDKEEEEGEGGVRWGTEGGNEWRREGLWQETGSLLTAFLRLLGL